MLSTPTKSWKKSRTLKLAAAIILGGGADLINSFLSGEMNWRAVAMLAFGILVVYLRLNTTHELV